MAATVGDLNPVPRPGHRYQAADLCGQLRRGGGDFEFHRAIPRSEALGGFNHHGKQPRDFSLAAAGEQADEALVPRHARQPALLQFIDERISHEGGFQPGGLEKRLLEREEAEHFI